jgi:hypothetical protein
VTQGARLRGGASLDLVWDTGKPVNATISFDNDAPERRMLVIYAGEQVQALMGGSGKVMHLLF